jgi:hypothetical protein
MILFAAISSSFAYNNVYKISLTAPGSTTGYTSFYTTTGIYFDCEWYPYLVPGSPSWDGTGYGSITNYSIGQLIDDYHFYGLQNNSAPYYRTYYAGTFNCEFALYYEDGPDTYGLAAIEW